MASVISPFHRECLGRWFSYFFMANQFEVVQATAISTPPCAVTWEAVLRAGPGTKVMAGKETLEWFPNSWLTTALTPWYPCKIISVANMQPLCLVQRCSKCWCRDPVTPSSWHPRFCAFLSPYKLPTFSQSTDLYSVVFCVFSLLSVCVSSMKCASFCGPGMLHLSNTSPSPVRWGQKVAKERGNMEKEKGSFPHVPLWACNSGLPESCGTSTIEVPLLVRRHHVWLWSWIWMCVFPDIGALWYCFFASSVSPGTHFLVFPRAGSSLSVQVPPQMKQRVKVMEDKGVGVGREYPPFITV